MAVKDIGMKIRNYTNIQTAISDFQIESELSFLSKEISLFVLIQYWHADCRKTFLISAAHCYVAFVIRNLMSTDFNNPAK